MAHYGGETTRDDVVIIGKKGPRGGSTLKSSAQINAAQRSGLEIDTEKKFDAGHNKQGTSIGPLASKLDRETEELRHEKIDLQLSKVIQQARNAKGMTQVDFARQINEKQQVVNEYEQGKTIPNQQILAKMERALGVKLRGKDIGQPLAKK